MRVKELGVFKPIRDEHYNLLCLSPAEWDWSGRKLWLHKIQPVSYVEIGSSNYSYDQIGTYNFIFHINPLGEERKVCNLQEDFYYILQVEICEWCRPNGMVLKELYGYLKKYPILFMPELLEAFKQRDFYMDNNMKIG